MSATYLYISHVFYHTCDHYSRRLSGHITEIESDTRLNLCLPLQDGSRVGAGGHGGVFCQATLGYAGRGRRPRPLALGKLGVGELDVDRVVGDVDLDEVTVLQ